MGDVGDLIATRLRKMRQEQGLSIAALSQQTVRLGYTGVGERTIQLIESEPGRVPFAHNIEALAAALGITPAELAEHEYPIAVARREARGQQ